jgi:hypothetical protein
MSVTYPTPQTSATPTPALGADVPPLPDNVRAFCDRHGLTAHLPTTFRLLREEFHPVGDIAVRLMEDPEADSTSLVLNVPVGGDVPTVHDSFRRFLERWIPVTPAAVRQLIAVIWTFRP